MTDKEEYAKNGEEKIKDAFKEKDWTEIRTNDSWALFKIMGEFVEGFEKMSKIGPCVSIFGSARTKPDNEYYKFAERIAKKITKNGYGVITGGGPGNSTTFMSIDLVKMAIGQFDLGPAAAMSLVYFLIILLLSWVFYTVMSNIGEESSNGGA